MNPHFCIKNTYMLRADGYDDLVMTMRTVDVFVAHDVVDACRGWQEVINTGTSIKEKEDAAEEAKRSLRDTGFRGSRKVIASSDMALLIEEMSPGDEMRTAQVYSDVVLAGWLGRIAKMRMSEQVTLLLPIYGAAVLRCADPTGLTIDHDDPLIVDDSIFDHSGRMKHPLHLPITFVNYAISAPDAIRM